MPFTPATASGPHSCQTTEPHPHPPPSDSIMAYSPLPPPTPLTRRASPQPPTNIFLPPPPLPTTPCDSPMPQLLPAPSNNLLLSMLLHPVALSPQPPRFPDALLHWLRCGLAPLLSRRLSWRLHTLSSTCLPLSACARVLKGLPLSSWTQPDSCDSAPVVVPPPAVMDTTSVVLPTTSVVRNVAAFHSAGASATASIFPSGGTMSKQR